MLGRLHGAQPQRLIYLFFANSFFVVLPVARLGSTHSLTGRQLLLQGTLDYDEERGAKSILNVLRLITGLRKGFIDLEVKCVKPLLKHRILQLALNSFIFFIPESTFR